MEATAGKHPDLLPEPIPPIRKKSLCLLLLTPPLLAILAGLLFPFFHYIEPMDAALTPVFMVLIGGLTACFRKVVGIRYRGRSLGFLTCAYLFGQLIACYVLWFGIVVLIAIVSPRFHI